jgi:hypothetical protein
MEVQLTLLEKVAFVDAFSFSLVLESAICPFAMIVSASYVAGLFYRVL